MSHIRKNRRTWLENAEAERARFAGAAGAHLDGAVADRTVIDSVRRHWEFSGEIDRSARWREVRQSLRVSGCVVWSRRDWLEMQALLLEQQLRACANGDSVVRTGDAIADLQNRWAKRARLDEPMLERQFLCSMHRQRVSNLRKRVDLPLDEDSEDCERAPDKSGVHPKGAFGIGAVDGPDENELSRLDRDALFLDLFHRFGAKPVVAVWFHACGYTWEDVAAMIGVSASTVRKWWERYSDGMLAIASQYGATMPANDVRQK